MKWMQLLQEFWFEHEAPFRKKAEFTEYNAEKHFRYIYYERWKLMWKLKAKVLRDKIQIYTNWINWLDGFADLQKDVPVEEEHDDRGDHDDREQENQNGPDDPEIGTDLIVDGLVAGQT